MKKSEYCYSLFFNYELQITNYVGAETEETSVEMVFSALNTSGRQYVERSWKASRYLGGKQ
jgi:hypothetical protein